jgi:putative cardiolipin synthase
VDGKVAITGGRNMAAEYYDYHHEYNFRDRDVLLLGPAAQAVQASFERFWGSELSARVETLYDGLGLFQRNVSVDTAEVRQIYRDLLAYARDPSNFAPEVRAAIADTLSSFARLARQMTWGRVEFLSDMPGKNGNRHRLGGGGITSAALARVVAGARERVTIESPYLVLSPEAVTLFKELVARGVKVRICTNSLASTDNLQAFSGYRNQREQLLRMGLQIHEYRPDPAAQRALIPRIPGVHREPPVFALHAKTLVVDGKVAITGGRNMADEYFDYDHDYNFRDRDVLLLGPAAQAVRQSFEAFWRSPLSARVETLYDGLGLMQRHVRVEDAEIQGIYRDLQAYARNPANFAPEVRAAIAATPEAFARLSRQMHWGDVSFVHDVPGKNDGRAGLGGGGRTTAALAALVEGARRRITLQSPYLVLSDEAIALFRRALARGVEIRISTNSLASTDNLQAFSGYRNQREALLAMGLKIYEYRPDPAVRRTLMQAATAASRRKLPVFALHAKTLVVDGEVAYIGTFNLDPRSENLNTEVGAILRDPALAQAVERAIETDMAPGNSWNAASDDPDRHVPAAKRGKVRFYQLLPLRPLL